jgi:hypothetical protein
MTYPKIRELGRICIEAIDDYDPEQHGCVYLVEREDIGKPVPDICL